jgi:hypothetical protein
MVKKKKNTFKNEFFFQLLTFIMCVYVCVRIHRKITYSAIWISKARRKEISLRMIHVKAITNIFFRFKNERYFYPSALHVGFY